MGEFRTLRKGDRVWFQSPYGKSREVEISRVGRKWVYFGDMRAEVGTDEVESLDGRYVLGTLYESNLACIQASEDRKESIRLRHDIQAGLSSQPLEILRAIAELMGLEN